MFIKLRKCASTSRSSSNNKSLTGWWPPFLNSLMLFSKSLNIISLLFLVVTITSWMWLTSFSKTTSVWSFVQTIILAYRLKMSSLSNFAKKSPKRMFMWCFETDRIRARIQRRNTVILITSFPLCFDRHILHNNTTIIHDILSVRHSAFVTAYVTLLHTKILSLLMNFISLSA